MNIYSFLYGVAATLILESVLLLAVTAWMRRRIRGRRGR